MKKFYLLFSLISFSVIAFAQKAIISGIVTDEKDKSPMIGVNIRLKGTAEGTSTDFDGKFMLEVAADKSFALELTYTGYQTRTLDFVPMKAGDTKTSNIQMTETSKDLDIVVISADKFEKSLGQQTISMEVLKGQNITQSNQTLNEAVNKVPGVTMMGKTISIRGGSGFADATSNRVMMLLDDIPVLNPDNGGINWNGMPTDAINQMEIVKGASSATAGGSALNGSINIRTITPTLGKPFNKVYLSGGFYDHHQKSEYWRPLSTVDKSGKRHYNYPAFGGVSFVHSSKIKNVDLTFNLGYTGNQGYMVLQSSNRARGYLKLKYSPSKMPNLAVGIATMAYVEKSYDFFRYDNYDGIDSVPLSNDTFVLVPKDGGNIVNAYSVNVLPYITYFDKHDNRHSLKTGFYYTAGYNTAGDSSSTYKVWGEYSFSKNYKELDLTLTTGVAGYYTKSPGNTFGNRFEANAAGFLQVEKRFFKRLTLSGGVRLEFNKLDTCSPMVDQWVLNKVLNRQSNNLIYSPIQPLFRFGVNFQALEATYLRASIGQGYRYPSMAEKFIQTARSGVYVIPNYQLRPEHGWSAEIGIKQAVKISKWVFYADLAGFVSKYRNMINFETAQRDSVPAEIIIPPSQSGALLTQAKNVERALVWGVEVSAIGTGKIFGIPLNFLIGYTYMDPRNLDYKKNISEPQQKYLMFRVKHAGKADIQVEPKSVIVGVTATLTSQIMNLGDYRKLNPIRKWYENHRSANFIFDARLGYNWKDKITATAIVKNILNSEYTQRPGYVEPPRNYTLLLTYSF